MGRLGAWMIAVFILIPGGSFTRPIPTAAQAITRTLDEVVARARDPNPEIRGQLWSELGLALDTFRTHDDSDRSPLPVQQLTCPAPDDYALVAIADQRRFDWRLLIFAPKAPGHSVVGVVDVHAQRHDPPGLNLVCHGSAAWVLIESDVVGGSGIRLREQRHYRFTGHGERLILRYPAQGHVIGWPLAFDRQFHATSPTPLNEAIAARPIAVSFVASYTVGAVSWGVPVGTPLITVSRKAVYVWDVDEGRYRLDGPRSDLTEDDIEGFFHDDEDRFLSRWLAELRALARSGMSAQKHWLRYLVGRLADSPARSALEEALR